LLELRYDMHFSGRPLASNCFAINTGGSMFRQYNRFHSVDIE